jgi:transposase-like protein
LNGKEPELSGKNRVFDVGFKQRVAQRILDGESVSALHAEFQIKRSVLYRWRDAYRKDGAAGLARPTGRPPGIPNPPRPPHPTASPEEAAARRVVELERKIGQQALDIDFLRRAFKRVKESRRKNTEAGGTASTEKSEA